MHPTLDLCLLVGTASLLTPLTGMSTPIENHQLPLLQNTLTFGLIALLLVTLFLLRHLRQLKRLITQTTQTNTQLRNAISQHQSTETRLQETQSYLHHVINSMPSVIIGVTSQGVITHWNESAERATQIKAVAAMGRALIDVFPAFTIDANLIQQTIDKGVPFTNKNVQYGEGSHTSFYDVIIYPLNDSKTRNAVIRIDDVTLRVHVENQMIQNEKMLSLGELAAGMAHEINNPLGAIIQSAQNIQRRLSPTLAANQKVANELAINLENTHDYLSQRQIPRFVDNIKEAGERAAAIVANMMEFSRYNNRHHSPVNLVQLLESTLILASNSFQLEGMRFSEITLKKHTPPEQTLIASCSRVEIQQVLLNILRNAAQALADAQLPSPTISIALTKEQGFAVIEISDNGPGMDNEIIPHIFEPFYTTKEVGKGTGLGLSVSYFIITERHQGLIEVSSNIDIGTQFRIKLPC